MARKIFKKQEIKNLEKKNLKQEIKKTDEVVEENYSYYVLIQSIRAFLDNSTTYLRLKKQVKERDKIIKINNEMIDFNEKDWLDIINRLLNFLMKKYPTLKSDFDFKVMDNKKVVRCAYMTKNLHLADYKMSYWKGVKTKYKELNEAWEFMLETLARFNVIQECAYSDKLKMDTKERATIRTVITKFNKTLRPKITTFLQENNI